MWVIILFVKTAALLSKKTLRSLKESWKQFSAIVGIGGIAVTLFVGLLSNSQSLASRVDSFYHEGNEADIYVTTTGRENGDLEAIQARLGEGDVVESRCQMVTMLSGRLSYGVIESLPLSEIQIAKPIHIETLSDQHSEDDFFLIDKALYDDAGVAYESGKVTVTYELSSLIDEGAGKKLSSFVKSGGHNIFGEKQLDIEYPLTGTMECSANVAKSTYSQATYFISKKMFVETLLDMVEENYNQMGVFLIDLFLGVTPNQTPDYHSATSFPADNQYLITLNDPNTRDAKEEAIRSYFAQKGPGSNLYAVTDRTSNPWSIAVDTDVQQAKQLTFVFPFVFFLVALLVILTTISEMIVKERTQIGTLKALGVKDGQIIRHYIGLTEVLVGIGIVLGFILGPLIIPGIMDQKYSILYSLPPKAFFVFPWWQALLTAAIFLGVAALTTFLASHKAIALMPAESMRGAPIAFKSHQRKDKNKKQGTFRLSFHMAVRNIRVNLAKSMMVIVGVMGCTALLCCGYGIDDTLEKGVSQEMAGYYNSSILLNYTTEGASHKEEILAFQGVKSVEEGYSSKTSIFTKDRTGVIGKSTTNTVFFFEEGSSHIPETMLHGQLIITQKIAEALEAEVGDLIYFNYGGNELSGRIGKIHDAFLTHGVFCYYGDYPAAFPEKEGKIYQSAWVDVEDSYDPMMVKERLQELSFVGSAKTKGELQNQIEDILAGISLMTGAVKVFAILLAVVVLYNLGLLNFRERMRDIATLKVLGFSKMEIALSLVSETMILTFVGAGLGLALGYPFMYLVLYVNRVALVEFLYTIFPWTYVFSFLLTFLVALLVNSYFSFLTGRVKMVESLKSVE